MSFDPGLLSGQTIDNTKLCEIFKCSPQGGMRRSKATNTLVIVSNHVESIYDDRWDENGIFHYTGMGTKGDQNLDFMQNRTLAKSDNNGIDVFLFQVHIKGQYSFEGQVTLLKKPYQEIQPDAHGNKRNVWMFPLQLAEGETPALIPVTILDQHQSKKRRKALKLSDAELETRAQHAPINPGVQRVQSQQYVRDTNVVEYAKRRAAGHCQLCGLPAPFTDKNGNPYLEVHHIIWLSRGGEDSIKNTVALCPNCHRKMHIVDETSDQNMLKEAIN